MKSSLFVLLLPVLLSPKVKDISDQSLPVDDLNRNSMDVVHADIDSDGDQDLIVACEFCPNYVLINNGEDKFLNESKLRLPQKKHDSEDIGAADFDKDGDIDLVFVSEDDKVHEYYINDGKGFFTDASDRIPVTSVTNAVCLLDTDKDGDTDLVFGNDGQDFLLLNDGKGNWTNATASLLPADADVTQDVKAFDADKDGDQDLIFGNEDSGKLYLNNGKGKFVQSREALPQVVNTVETRKIEISDIDKDGDQDLFYCNVAFRKERSRQNLILLNNGKGRFSDVTASHYKGDNDFMSLDAQFVDLNRDGQKDLIVANGFGARLQFFHNNKGVFTESRDPELPAFAGMDVISMLYFNPGRQKKEFIYLGLFRGKDKLLQLAE